MIMIFLMNTKQNYFYLNINYIEKEKYIVYNKAYL